MRLLKALSRSERSGGRSAHHSIHGNGNRNVKIKNVDFEIAAIALNGVEGLKVIETTARNREDVPVIGTYSNARFISPYLDWLVMTGSSTTLRVQGIGQSASQIQAALWKSVNEVVAVKQGNGPAIDPIGAVFMLKNTHPDTGAPITVTSLEDGAATYQGNMLANAQALVAKAAHNGEFPPFLNVSRLNITPKLIDWIESQGVLSDLVPTPTDYLCNGDTMFHVNKGVIGFKIDGAVGVRMRDTSAEGLENLGLQGTSLCGDYKNASRCDA